ncbi:MAG: homoserine O-acetyltransferase [Thermonemataceae bacterium]|nr:homoserine O-acetyltransferase [Thermonemataceae bacterium]
MQKFHYKQKFELEAGGYLPELEVAFHTFGKLNEEKNNVIWICHAFTANSNPVEWWEGLVGEGKLYDTNRYFVVCANMIGSCYGSTYPLSVNPETEMPYYHSFPMVTIRDVVRSLDLLRIHLGIEQIFLLTGGSLGGQQALEWALMLGEKLLNLVLLATNIRHSAWAIAFNEAQRMAISSDNTWQENSPNAGKEGMRAARAIALLSYRNYETYQQTQKEAAETLALDNFRASSYQQYQGDKLKKRFDAFAYWGLSKTMDSHNICRNRGTVAEVLAGIKAKTLVIGIKSDILFPIEEQKIIAENIKNSHLCLIESLYGHDGFLIENHKISECITSYINI